MHINLYLIAFIVILGLFLSAKDNDRNRLLYIIGCNAVLIFVAAMRSPEWMTYTYEIDTLNYQDSFVAYSDLEWGEVWTRFRMRYVFQEEEYDIGFIVLNKIIGLITNSFQVYSFLADLIFFIPFGVILYRYCTSIFQIMFAFVFYIALVQVFLFGGARQIFAIGFDLMAIIAMIDKKKLFAILFFILGLTIHFSSFLFLLPLLMIWIRIKPQALKWIHFVCFIFFPLVLLVPNQVVSMMGTFLGIDRYAAYGVGEARSGVGTFLILMELLSLFCLIAIKKRDLAGNYAVTCFYTMAPLITLTAPLIRANGAMIRVSLYYYLFLIILFPFSIDCLFKGNVRKAVYFVALAALSYLVVSGGGTVYYFYWQTM